MKIRQWAKGKWPQIVSALVGEQYADTRKHQPCPKGEGTDRYRLSDCDGYGRYFCACNPDGREGCDGFDLLMCVHGWTFQQAAEAVQGVIGECPKDAEDTKPKAETWASRLRREVVQTGRSSYLEGRGLEVPPGLDWHKALSYFDSDGNRIGDYQAMLAPLMRGNRFVTYHATYIDRGQKANVDPARKILPSDGPLEGAACPLYQPEGKVIGIAEGVETAIAAKMIHDMPTWAALNTALMAKWKPPEGIEGVFIWADHDHNYAGHAAAYQLAHRLETQGWEVIVKFPPEAGMDWNDVLLEGEAAA